MTYREAWAIYAKAWDAYARIVCDPVHWAEYRAANVTTYAEAQRLVPLAWERAHVAWDAATEERAALDAAERLLEMTA